MRAAGQIRFILCTLLLGCTTALSTASYAAEQGSGAARDSEAPVSADGAADQQARERTGDAIPDAADKKAKTKSRGTTDQEIFRPSEEISEDFAVSFPVDI